MAPRPQPATPRREFLKRLGAASVAAVLPAGAAWPPHPAADDYWELVRAQYPLTRDRVYFNTGGLGPAPYPVVDAVASLMMQLQRLSEHGHNRIVEARAPVARFFGVKPEEVAFMRNATEGNATIASGLTFLRPGDEVIFESHAHPGGAIPWMSRQKQQGIKVRIFEPDPTSAAGNLERIEALITPRTRVIQVSHTTAPTGIRMPVDAIAALVRDRGIWFHIDGAQSAGAYPFDLGKIGCDSYATSGHKWLGATHGTGVLYVREDRLDDVAPTEAGAYSDDGAYALPDTFDYNKTAQRYEPGTRDATSVAGLVAAVQFMETIGMDRVAAYSQGLALRLQGQLRAMAGITVLTPEDPSLSAGITTFKLEKMPYDELFRVLLSEHKMRCRVVTEQGLDALRVSTHVFNSEEEVDRLAEAVGGIARG
ncbi:MAG: aminotransferase class V-fold PLP-dependent enzyme [Rhodothermales bacterium]|nr:aminotransferase class V-fold PLP-dependent enzyme [Rhodothermales bacterium]